MEKLLEQDEDNEELEELRFTCMINNGQTRQGGSGKFGHCSGRLVWKGF